MLNSLMQVSINAPESAQCSDVFKSAVDNWLKTKPQKKLKKRATVSAQSGMTVETSQPSERESQVVELKAENTEEVPEGRHGVPDAATQEDRQSDHGEAAVQDEAAAVATAIGLPDSDYESAIESDCDTDDEFY